MTMDGPQATAGQHGCWGEHRKPAKHHSRSCVQACAAICGVTAALPEAAPDLSLTPAQPRVEPAALVPLHAHTPPGLKRPPKHDA